MLTTEYFFVTEVIRLVFHTLVQICFIPMQQFVIRSSDQNYAANVVYVFCKFVPADIMSAKVFIRVYPGTPEHVSPTRSVIVLLIIWIWNVYNKFM